MTISAANAAERFMLFRSRYFSLWLQARVLDDALGLDPILLEELREFLGRIEHGLEPARGQVLLAEYIRARDLPHLRGDLGNDGGRGAHRRVEREIGPRQRPAIAGFPQRRDVGE